MPSGQQVHDFENFRRQGPLFELDDHQQVDDGGLKQKTFYGGDDNLVASHEVDDHSLADGDSDPASSIHGHQEFRLYHGHGHRWDCQTP